MPHTHMTVCCKIRAPIFTLATAIPSSSNHTLQVSKEELRAADEAAIVEEEANITPGRP